MEKVYNKLVRDSIPKIIEKKGHTVFYHELSSEEYWEALLVKDQEELEEVRTAPTKSERKKELADKLELIIAMAEYNGYTIEDIKKEAEKKKESNGGFSKRLFLEKVIEK